MAALLQYTEKPHYCRSPGAITFSLADMYWQLW